MMQHKISAVLLFLLVPAAMIACILLQSPQTALLSTLVLLAALTPFFLAFERQKPRPRDFMPVVVLTALSVTGRLLFAALPNFKPVSAIVILAGVCFGRQSGFLTGALSALVSNLFFGQGPWTPWQMYAWGLMGYVAGALASTKLFRRPWAVLLYGFLASFGYGFLMNSWTLFSFVQPVTWQAALATYGAALAFDATHAVSTVAFLSVTLLPWQKELRRIRQKYGVREL
ncbi:MAG: ECF transporter S component [Clostridiales bacterium]|nr:ECF transporter S component [Clostridiales bacterium]